MLRFVNNLTPAELALNTAGKCICCQAQVEPIVRETMIPCYDDGGSLDSFDVTYEHIGNEPLCQGCADHVPGEVLDRIYGYEPEQVLPQDTYNGDLMGDEELPF